MVDRNIQYIINGLENNSQRNANYDNEKVLAYYKQRCDETNKFITKQYHVLYLMLLFFFAVLYLKYQSEIFNTLVDQIPEIHYISLGLIIFIGIIGIYELCVAVRTSDKNSKLRIAIEQVFIFNRNRGAIDGANKLFDFPCKKTTFIRTPLIGIAAFIFTLILFVPIELKVPLTSIEFILTIAIIISLILIIFILCNLNREKNRTIRPQNESILQKESPNLFKKVLLETFESIIKEAANKLLNKFIEDNLKKSEKKKK